MARVSGKLMAKSAVLALLFAAGLGLAACNTMHGFGEDLSHVGDKISAKAGSHTN